MSLAPGSTFGPIRSYITQHPIRTLSFLLLCLGFISRYMLIALPNSAVFDEVHFNYFSAFYYTGQYYYDIHPPLGKLLIALSALPFGGIAPEEVVRTISAEYPSDIYIVLRSLPAFFSALLPFIIFQVALELNIRTRAAFLAGFMVVFDNALLLQGKLILLDAMLLTFGFSALWLLLRSRRTQQHLLLIPVGILAGCSISVKWIGVSFLGLIGLIMIFDWLYSLWRNGWQNRPFLAGLAVLGLTLLTYTSTFAIHFALLPVSHQQGDQFMSADFQSTLQGSRYHGATSVIRNFHCPPDYKHSLSYGAPDTSVSSSEKLFCKIEWTEIHSPSFLQKLIELNRTMYTTNQGLSKSHPDASAWYTWPMMSKALYYWYKDGARIYLAGNPIVWWFGFIAVLTMLAGSFFLPQWRKLPAFWILQIGFWSNMLPFMLVNRVMFMYHYLTSLGYTILMLALLIDQFKHRNKFVWAFLAASFLGFIVLSPLTFGANWYGSDLMWLLKLAGWHP
ncbi:hypothetical protein TDB9533_03641 [Thalassocella blandensis]|nr:hypothetical protein TDB9533_03641 [Thalassocella blandensis]